MVVTCTHGCGRKFDDEYRTTLCPHDAFLANDGKNHFAVHHDSYLEPTAQQGDVRMSTHSGTIKRIVADRGFGFIEVDGTAGEELFFHATATQGTKGDREFQRMKEGQRVTFDIGKGEKGPRAVDVRFQTRNT